MGADLVLGVIDELEAGTAQPINQDKTLASKAPRLKKDQGMIDWSRPALEIKNQVRAVRPWPRAYTFWHRTGAEPLRLNIDRLATSVATPGVASASPSPNAQAAPGTILDISGQFLIATGDRALEILQLQPAGKRSMATAEFLRGYHPQIGDRFSNQ